MPAIPHDPPPDSSLALMREGNTFIASRCQRFQSDVFQARLLLQDTLCLHGEVAARLFYDEQRFTRHKAAPERLEKTLFGRGGVQGLDGEAHRVRKAMFLALMSDADIDELARFTREGWQQALEEWRKADAVELLPAVERIHCRAVCRWAGVPLEEDELEQRREELSAMIDGAGGVGKRHWQARHARSRAEAWIQALVEQVRTRKCLVNEDRALFRISWHHDADGQLLEPHTAAVEVLNLLRPTVAIARYVSFAVLALHEHPRWYASLETSDEGLEPFVQEVRRYYTFFPFVAARVRESFDWQGYHFPRGQRVLLDLYGTNRDARTWHLPEAFRPERFSQEPFNAYSFIPQGGGDHASGHRCPGEWFTIALMKVAVAQLTRAMRYTVPEQDMDIDWSRMPILPRSGLVIARVEPR